MSMYKDSEKITFTIQEFMDAMGKETKLAQGVVPQWASSDPTAMQITAAADGMSAVGECVDVNKPFVAQVSIPGGNGNEAMVGVSDSHSFVPGDAVKAVIGSSAPADQPANSAPAATAPATTDASDAPAAPVANTAPAANESAPAATESAPAGTNGGAANLV